MKEWLKSGGSSWGSVGSGWGTVKGSSWIPQKESKKEKVIVKKIVKSGNKNG